MYRPDKSSSGAQDRFSDSNFSLPPLPVGSGSDSLIENPSDAGRPALSSFFSTSTIDTSNAGHQDRSPTNPSGSLTDVGQEWQHPVDDALPAHLYDFFHHPNPIANPIATQPMQYTDSVPFASPHAMPTQAQPMTYSPHPFSQFDLEHLFASSSMQNPLQMNDSVSSAVSVPISNENSQMPIDLQDPSRSSSGPVPKHRRTAEASGSPSSSRQRTCNACGISDSPEWRKGPDGHKTLCNACGLRHSRNESRLRRQYEKNRLVDEIVANGGPTSPQNRQDKERKGESQRRRSKSHPAKVDVSSLTLAGFDPQRLSMPNSSIEEKLATDASVGMRTASRK
jgi:hypothetical protein